MLQLTGSKHSYFRAVDCFQGDDITQSRWVPPRIVSLSHTPQLHMTTAYMTRFVCLCVCACMQDACVPVCVCVCDHLNSTCSQLPENDLCGPFSLQKTNYRLWVKVRIGAGIAGKSWTELVPCGRCETRGVARGLDTLQIWSLPLCATPKFLVSLFLSVLGFWIKSLHFLSHSGNLCDRKRSKVRLIFFQIFYNPVNSGFFSPTIVALKGTIGLNLLFFHTISQKSKHIKLHKGDTQYTAVIKNASHHSNSACVTYSTFPKDTEEQQLSDGDSLIIVYLDSSSFAGDNVF